MTVHEPLAGMVPPESATLLPPLAAVTVPAPHVVAPAGAAVFTRPAGYVSVNAAPVIATAFGVGERDGEHRGRVRRDRGRREGLGDRRVREHGERRGGAAVAVPALVVVTAPVELLYAPAACVVTFTVTVHEPVAGTVPPASATLVPLLAAVTVPPPHVVAPRAWRCSPGPRDRCR